MKKAKPNSPPSPTPSPTGDKVAYYLDPNRGFRPRILRFRYTKITEKLYTGCKADSTLAADDYRAPNVSSRLPKENIHPTFNQAKACMAAYLTGRLERLKKQLKETREDIQEVTGWEESFSESVWKVDPFTRHKRITRHKRK